MQVYRCPRYLRDTRYLFGEVLAISSDSPPCHDSGTSIWFTTIPLDRIRHKLAIQGTIFYGYRPWGANRSFDPNWTKGSNAGFVADVDKDGNRFNPNKLLYDPHATRTSQDPITPQQRDETIYSSGTSFPTPGAKGPKGLCFNNPTGGIGAKPFRAHKGDIIYEVHLR